MEQCNEFYHHGIKGQRWGVRRYQNKDGSYKSNAKGRYNDDGDNIASNRTLAKNLADNNLSSKKKYDLINEELDRNNEKLYKKYGAKNGDEVWLNTRNNKAKWNNYINESDAIYRKYEKKVQEWEKERDKERSQVVKKVFFNSEIKPEITNAKKLKQEMKTSADSILGTDSANYKKAYKEYAKRNGDNEESKYGFDHYEWREGKPAYDSAYKEYRAKNEQLLKNYDKTVSDIGKKVYGEFSDKKMSNGLDMTYSEFGKTVAEKLTTMDKYERFFS